MSDSADERWMRRALQCAERGRGFVEPNPLVGCVIVRDDRLISEGWHERFGEPHAEALALAAAREPVAGATIYVTLEPCCHHGKTPPCTAALLAACPGRIVIAQSDPFPLVAGRGIRALREAGIDVTVGVLHDDARRQSAPYLKLLECQRPWVIAKWAMTLDGKIATRAGDSHWISGEASRQRVHQLRGRMDAIVVGLGTVRADNPLLTARPAGPRVAARVVLDTHAQLDVESRLVQSVAQAPVIVAAGAEAPAARCEALRQAGCEVLVISGDNYMSRWKALLDELGRRRWTNLLVEGGSRVLGTCFDSGLVDEVWCFVAPRVSGGRDAPSSVGGEGCAQISAARPLADVELERIDDDVLIRGRCAEKDASNGGSRRL